MLAACIYFPSSVPLYLLFFPTFPFLSLWLPLPILALLHLSSPSLPHPPPPLSSPPPSPILHPFSLCRGGCHHVPALHHGVRDLLYLLLSERESNNEPVSARMPNAPLTAYRVCTVCCMRRACAAVLSAPLLGFIA